MVHLSLPAGVRLHLRTAGFRIAGRSFRAAMERASLISSSCNRAAIHNHGLHGLLWPGHATAALL